MPPPYKIDPLTFNGFKFAERYSLGRFDYFVIIDDLGDYQLQFAKGISIPDDPPIFDPLDSKFDLNKNSATKSINEDSPNGNLLRAILSRIAEIEAVTPDVIASDVVDKIAKGVSDPPLTITPKP